MYYCQLINGTIIQSETPFTFDELGKNNNTEGKVIFRFYPGVSAKEIVFNFSNTILFWEEE